MKLGIIVIGYNRKKPLERLLYRLNECYYSVPAVLLISIDYSGRSEIEEVAKSFEWEHGEKKVISYPERLGLRKHILLCGSYMEEYDLDAVAVFEDDIYPSESFFSYMKQAVEFYKDDDRIAGISLYKHTLDTERNLPFEPMRSPFDAYFLQYAQSWGQIWMRKQWRCFSDWYEKNKSEFKGLEYLPNNVNCWPETSWLKYHIRYCVENNKYFVYPYNALSTCFAEAGEHTDKRYLRYQVPLDMGKNKEYCFPRLGQDGAVYYDVFFENTSIGDYLGKAEICVDLYGYKESTLGKRYWLTTKILGYEVVETFGLVLKPQELNCIYHIPGNDIFLYDTWNKAEPRKNKKNLLDKWEYYYGSVSPVKISAWNGIQIYKDKVKRRLKLK